MGLGDQWRTAQAGIYSRNKRTPAHDAMARVLRCDWADWWAMLPFAPVEIDGAWWIAASDTLSSDGDILLIDGATGHMRWGDDERAVGFWGGTAHGPVKVYANGLTFAREWVDQRKEAQRRIVATGPAHRTPDMLEQIAMPGIAMIGHPARIGNFAAVMAAEQIEIDTPKLRQPLADAILTAARLPIVTVARPKMVAA